MIAGGGGPSPHHLRGFGAELVRERDLARRVQSGLERLYQLERVVDVDDFIEAAESGGRETLLLRECEDGALEMRLVLPIESLAECTERRGMPFDRICQIIEGVSHFVYVAERAQAGRETTQLELEVQAEVDKFVVLGSSVPQLDQATALKLCHELYERVHYAHDAESSVGERYRLANEAAHRYVRHLSRTKLADMREARASLRRFYQMGQEEKLRAVT